MADEVEKENLKDPELHEEEEEEICNESPLVLQRNGHEPPLTEEKVSLLDSKSFTASFIRKESDTPVPQIGREDDQTDNDDDDDDDKSLLPDKHSPLSFLDCFGLRAFVASYRSTNPQKRITPFAIVLLLVLLLLYVLNQADRLVLAVLIPSGLRCNDEEDNSTSNSNNHCPVPPTTNNASINSTALYTDCIEFGDTEQGLLTGPAFVIVYVITGLPLAYLADTRSRPLVLLVGVGFWSVMVFLTGFVKKFWQLLLLRVMLGIGEVRTLISILYHYFNYH